MTVDNGPLPSLPQYPEFANMCVVVTGAGSGIGRATALAFADAGARLALLDVAPAGLHETVERASGEDHLILECDVSRPTEVSNAFSRITTLHGQIDVLVNNAGINPPVGSVLDVDEAYYDHLMNVNAKGMFFCAQAALRTMMPQASGNIVNLGSVSGMIGWGGSAVYSASKGAVLALTRALAVEVAPYGIRVNAVAPGSVRTPMVQDNLRRLEDPENAWKRTAELHPLGRVAEPREVTEAILFLASSRSSFVTGSVLTIDGGLTAQ